MKQIFVIIAASTDSEPIWIRRAFGTREEVQQIVMDMIRQDADCGDESWDCGTENASDLQYEKECNGFSGYNHYEENTILYYAYPVNDIPMTMFQIDTKESKEKLQVVNKGFIQTESFCLTEFDWHDGFRERNVPAGMYEYRVLDIRGWRPYQLLVGGEWVDIAGNDELVGAIRKQIEESDAAV